MNIGPSLAHGLTSQKNLARAHFGPTIFWPTMGRAKTEPNHSQSPSRLELGRPMARHNPKTDIIVEARDFKYLVLNSQKENVEIEIAKVLTSVEVDEIVDDLSEDEFEII